MEILFYLNVKCLMFAPLADLLHLFTIINIYIYIYMYMCVLIDGNVSLIMVDSRIHPIQITHVIFQIRMMYFTSLIIDSDWSVMLF